MKTEIEVESFAKQAEQSTSWTHSLCLCLCFYLCLSVCLSVSLLCRDITLPMLGMQLQLNSIGCFREEGLRALACRAGRKSLMQQVLIYYLGNLFVLIQQKHVSVCCHHNLKDSANLPMCLKNGLKETE